MLTTKAIHKSFVKNMFEEPTTKQRLVANGLPPDQISRYFKLAFSITIETKLTMFQYKILHGIIDNHRLCKLTNHLLLIAKYYIYCCSINEEPLLFCAYQTIVISKAEIEKQISTKTNSNERYYNKWKPLIEKTFVT